jgi:uncharacterized protein YndB with AHSA1/START domain
MTTQTTPARAHDPERDLVLGRTLELPVERIWQAWTEPEHLMAWFAPAPWQTVACEIDLRPGGIFRTVMRGPDGTTHDDPGGCYLELQAPNRLVWTSALGPGFRPHPVDDAQADDHGFQFTAELTFELVDERTTRYTARAIHATSEAARAHEAMGFEPGWNAAVDQLVAHMTVAARR